MRRPTPSTPPGHTGQRGTSRPMSRRVRPSAGWKRLGRRRAARRRATRCGSHSAADPEQPAKEPPPDSSSPDRRPRARTTGPRPHTGRNSPDGPRNQPVRLASARPTRRRRPDRRTRGVLPHLFLRRPDPKGWLQPLRRGAATARQVSPACSAEDVPPAGRRESPDSPLLSRARRDPYRHRHARNRRARGAVRT